MLCLTVHLEGRTERTLHAAVAVGHKVYSLGGYGDTLTYMYNMDHIDVYVFNTVSLRWMKLPGDGEEQRPPGDVPSMRWGHTAVLIEDIIYIWGGFSNTGCNDLYAFDVDTHRWFKPGVSGAVPEARWRHSACVLKKVMYIFGGFNQLTGYTNDIYKLDTDTMVWSLVSAAGDTDASSHHSATIIGTKMFVFGGLGEDEGLYNNVRVFDTETDSWLSTPSSPGARRLLPEEREGHSAFVYNGELYIFGGNGLERTFDDLWKFNPESFSWKKVELKKKGPCWMYRMRCCMVGDRIILFGGYTPHGLCILDLSPSLKTLCKLTVIQHGLERSGLPRDINWELAVMTSNTRDL